MSPQCDIVPAARPVGESSEQITSTGSITAFSNPMPPCQIIQAGTTAVPPDTLQVDFKNTKLYLTALEAYAHALVTISNSTDNDTLNKNVGSLNSSLTQLGTTVATAYPQEKVPEQVAVAGTGALSDLSTSYFNWVRFRALRDGVHNANATVIKVAQLVRLVFMQTTGKIVGRLADQMSAMPIMVKGKADKVVGKNRTAAIAAAVAKADQINALLDVNPANVGASLADAHTVFDQALQGSVSEAAAAQAMAAFLKAAQNAQNSLTQATKSLGQ